MPYRITQKVINVAQFPEPCPSTDRSDNKLKWNWNFVFHMRNRYRFSPDN